MLRRALGACSAILLGWVCGGCACGGCDGEPREYPVSDAQIQQLLQGTAAPTTNGCQAVCNGIRSREFGDFSDAGPDRFTVEGCALSDHELTCTFRVCAL